MELTCQGMTDDGWQKNKNQSGMIEWVGQWRVLCNAQCNITQVLSTKGSLEGTINKGPLNVMNINMAHVEFECHNHSNSLSTSTIIHFPTQKVQMLRVV